MSTYDLFFTLIHMWVALFISGIVLLVAAMLWDKYEEWARKK